MRYAVIADIHANLPALRVVLEDIKAQQCSRIVCLGDLVGYNPYPKECLDKSASISFENWIFRASKEITTSIVRRMFRWKDSIHERRKPSNGPANN
jgi:hypothetical protein